MARRCRTGRPGWRSGGIVLAVLLATPAAAGLMPFLMPPAGRESAEVLPISGPEVLERARARHGVLTLVNVWATWCLPCKEEFPHLLRLRREYASRGLRLMLISGDFDSELPEVHAFLAEQGVSFTTYWKAGKDMEFIEALSPDWSGALPATFLVDADGTVRDFWEGRADYRTFEARVLALLEEGNEP